MQFRQTYCTFKKKVQFSITDTVDLLLKVYTSVTDNMQNNKHRQTAVNMNVLQRTLLFTLCLLCSDVGCFDADIGCFVPGSCEDGGEILAINFTLQNAYECGRFCDGTPRCLYFTFNPSTDRCIAYETCDNLSVDACAECISGDNDCTSQTPCFE